MPRPLLIFSQSDHLIQIVDTNSHILWQTVQIQISCFLINDFNQTDDPHNATSLVQHGHVVLSLYFTCEFSEFTLFAKAGNIRITKTHLFKYIENFTTKNGSFQIKIMIFFFHISAQKIDCGYSFEPPRRGGSNEYQQSLF